jgi:hypothetical protein
MLYVFPLRTIFGIVYPNHSTILGFPFINVLHCTVIAENSRGMHMRRKEEIGLVGYVTLL